MQAPVLVLHDAAHDALAEAIGEALAERGVSAVLGPPERAEEAFRVLVLLVPLSGEHLTAATRRGAAVLPVGEAEGWLGTGRLEARAKRVADAIDALLIIGRPDGRTGGQTITRARADIDRVLAEASDLSPLVRICEALSVAIQWGVPLYNADDPEGCAHIYRAASDAVRRFIAARVADGRGQLLDAVDDELAGVEETLAALGETAWDEQAWTLRHTFDRILIARRTADALFAIDDLFGGLMRAGRLLNASLVYDVISVAISHGAPIYNSGSPVGCAQIYLGTAAGLLKLLGAEQREGEGRTEPMARDILTPLVAGGARRLEDDPDGLAWSLRRAFDRLVETAAEERRWEHDS